MRAGSFKKPLLSLSVRSETACCAGNVRNNGIHVGAGVSGSAHAELLLFLPECFAARALTRQALQICCLFAYLLGLSLPCHRLQRQEEDKLDGVPKEHGVVPPLGEHPSLPVCTSQNQGTEVQGDSMPFCNDIFTIVPMVSDS